MAPKRASGKTIQGSTSERNTKASLDFDVSTFISEKATTHFDQIKKRAVLTGRKVEFEELHKEGFDLNIYLSKWSSFLTMDKPVYPNLVRIFYSNLVTLNHSFHISSRVNGVDIEFDESIFHQLFNIYTKNTELEILETQ